MSSVLVEYGTVCHEHSAPLRMLPATPDIEMGKNTSLFTPEFRIEANATI